MKLAQEIISELTLFYGTENYYRHRLSGLNYTDGVQYLAEAAECYWLIDAIGSYQPQCKRDPMLRDMQFWTLKRTEGTKFSLTCERDSDDVAIRQEIGFSDFPLNEIKIWVENGVMYLPSER